MKEIVCRQKVFWQAREGKGTMRSKIFQRHQAKLLKMGKGETGGVQNGGGR